MARSRNIKPSFFENEELGDLCPLSRLLFIGMWTIADHKGCFEYRPKRLKVQLLPYDNCDIEQLAINLDKSGFISIYSVQGQRYIKVINFLKHQNPHKNERDKGSDIPDIEMADIIEHENQLNINDLQNIENNHDKNGTTHDKNESDRADSLNLIPSTLIPDSLNTDTRNHETNVSPSDKPKKKTVLKMIPHDFGISDQVRKWAIENNHNNLEIHLERFIEYANSNAKKYADWDSAFKRAIREDWGKVNKPVYQNTNYQNTSYQTAQQRTATEQDMWRQAYEQSQQQNEIDVTPQGYYLNG